MLLATTSHADSRRDEARAHHLLGKVEFDRGHFPQALVEFKRAYELAPVPELLFNMARCQEQVGDPAGAIASYEQYVAAKPDAADRAEVESHVEALRRATHPVEPAPPTPVLTVTPPAAAIVAPTATVVAPAPRPRSRRALWIGLGVGIGAAIIVGGVVAGVLLSRPSEAEPYRGNFNPSFTQINP